MEFFISTRGGQFWIAFGKCRDSAPQRSLGGFLYTFPFMACNERLEETVQQFSDNSAYSSLK
ncbi:hypothetical protein [Humidesulfovibrio mexicanus]|uniref:hypothetical protein n=1 Tax=Humidesulfovibrio mexicanus TaxID=147047 RepID=UPI0015C5EC88|nr:hypothetical protein [Humidesulfovibrio mexicanus]